jgi:hypothetical protein
MSRQSAVIRGCLGDPPYVFSTADRKKYGENGGADREFVHYVAPTSDERRVIDLSALGELRRPGKALTRPLVALHSTRSRTASFCGRSSPWDRSLTVAGWPRPERGWRSAPLLRRAA